MTRAILTRRSLLGALAAPLAAKKPPTILLRSGWQTVNIGDIAHSPGVLAAIEKHLPEANLIFWSTETDRGVEPMLKRRFPKLEIVRDGTARFAEADLLIHGSAASMAAAPHVSEWKKATGKPFGFFGVGVTVAGEAAGSPLDDLRRDLAKSAAFLFTRETKSLANLKAEGLDGPNRRFVPDGTFSFDLRDEIGAEKYLRETGLAGTRFAAFIPRLRYTPYHRFRATTWSEAEKARRDSENAKYAERDHAKMREAIVAWVRKGNRALLCPEMTYEIDEIDPLLYDPLPDDVKPKVVRRKAYWLPDEATSVYAQARAIVSFECHSPILAATRGTPCLYIHQPEDGIKFNMWADVGLGDWCLPVDSTSGSQLAAKLFEIDGKNGRARAAVAKAQRLHAEGMRIVKKTIA
ncbi:MAG: polysaccharide pyruvyl transferase family protein [Bryobacteraceae bacterium]|nr:polysaccharide pyruvyl transferase family protein [Bryobacteraceae bacterium]